MSVRILTWNVWFGQRAFRRRASALMRELERRRPDVIALQEVTPPLLRILDEELAGYQLHGGDSPFGYDVVLLTRAPVRAVTALPLPSEMGRRLLVAELASGLAVATVHLESTGACTPERVEQLRIIGPHLVARATDAVLVGDMNFAADAAAETAALDPSFVDVWPATRGDDPGYTVDSVANPMRADLRGVSRRRIDRVFLRARGWRARSIELVGTEPIDDADTFVSDHFGLVTELDPVVPA